MTPTPSTPGTADRPALVGGAPVRGPSGFMIFHLLDRQAGSETVRPYEEVRMQIYGEMMEEAMAEQEQIFLAELRRAAVIDVRL